MRLRRELCSEWDINVGTGLGNGRNERPAPRTSPRRSVEKEHLRSSLSCCRLNFNAVIRLMRGPFHRKLLWSALWAYHWNVLIRYVSLCVSLLLLLFFVSGKSLEDKMLYLIYFCISEYIHNRKYTKTIFVFWFGWNKQSPFTRKKYRHAFLS